MLRSRLGEFATPRVGARGQISNIHGGRCECPANFISTAKLDDAGRNCDGQAVCMGRGDPAETLYLDNDGGGYCMDQHLPGL